MNQFLATPLRAPLLAEVEAHLDKMKQSKTSFSRTIDGVLVEWQAAGTQGNLFATFNGTRVRYETKVVDGFKARFAAYTDAECTKRKEEGLSVVVHTHEAADPLVQRAIKTPGANVRQIGFEAPLPPLLPAGGGTAGHKGLDDYMDDELRALRVEVDTKLREREVANACDRALEEGRRGLKRDRDALDARETAFAKEQMAFAEELAKEKAEFLKEKAEVNRRTQAFQSLVGVLSLPVGPS